MRKFYEKMEKRIIARADLQSFHQYLIREEKSTATVEKYLRDARAFLSFLGDGIVNKEVVMAYKKELQIKEYAVRSINSMLASINSFLKFCGWTECKIKNIRQQHQTYCPEEKELSRAEYLRLIESAKNQPRLSLLLKTICGTGIRVSELKYFHPSERSQTVPSRSSWRIPARWTGRWRGTARRNRGTCDLPLRPGG